MQNGSGESLNQMMFPEDYFGLPGGGPVPRDYSRISEYCSVVQIVNDFIEKVVHERGEALYNSGCMNLLKGQVESTIELSVAMMFLEGGCTLPSCVASSEAMPATVEMDAWNRNCIAPAKLRQFSTKIRPQSKHQPTVSPPAEKKQKEQPTRQFNFTMTRLQPLDHFEELLRQSKTAGLIPKKATKTPIKVPVASKEKLLDLSEPASNAPLLRKLITHAKSTHQR